MLRTSLRKVVECAVGAVIVFLSSNAQDFIEEKKPENTGPDDPQFLSSNAQDFIEDVSRTVSGGFSSTDS